MVFHRLIVDREGDVLSASCECGRWRAKSTLGDDIAWQFRVHKDDLVKGLLR
jgi:hypothetical protein